ncbi:uncharacterized protein yc1106_08892 [Curvularia clavata]|uniref:Prion-inhibition and propagation HeLo domain-containing protein n=1 Tax=Curvularia clavata TaxID=95742 RepID=A0A9Q8ZK87_CURCL|nr:uncharacterized protein yc1106_08892 [Curvularia clavata]
MERLFQDLEKFQVRYGCKEVKETLSRRKSTGLDDSDPMNDLAASFPHFYVPETSNTLSKPQRTKVLTKVRWAIYGRKKFDGLIREVKDLVEGLQNITDSIFATSRQGGMLRFGIQQIKNLDTLEIISAACEEDYPDISDAATVKMDVMTVGNFQSQDVQDWLDGTQEAGDDSILQTVPKPNPGSDSKNSLNAIMCEYFLKKGYTDARAVLIAETWAVPDTKPAQSEANTAVAKRKPDAAQDNTTNDRASTSSGKRRRATRQTSRTPASTQHS